MRCLSSFRRGEDGAVTVDWIVLVAAIVALALAVLSLAASGATDAGDRISSQLSAQSILTF